MSAALWEEALRRLLQRAYMDGAGRVAGQLGLTHLMPELQDDMEYDIARRINLGGKVIENYVDKIDEFASALSERGVQGPEWEAAVDAYARKLATDKAELVAEYEYGRARFVGAKDMADASGYEVNRWVFEHEETGSPDHEECEICEGIRTGGADGSYTTEEAEEKGFPDMPHPFCDHAWLVDMKALEEAA